MNSFFVTLPSNVQTNQETNTIGDYVTTLPNTLRLDPSWRVAITELFFTNSWYNLVQESEVKINVYDWSGPRAVLSSSETFTIEPGRYSTINDILDRINGHESVVMAGSKNALKLAIETKTNHIMSTIGKSKSGKERFMYEFDSTLAELLGVPNNNWTKLPKTQLMLAPKPFNKFAGTSTLQIDSDAVDYSIIGSKSAQLLRITHIPPLPFGNEAHIVFDKPYYLPLSRDEISQIRITIKDEQENKVDFKFGKVIVILHFTQDIHPEAEI